MFNRLTWFIATKYLTSKHENGFITFIAAISMIGVSLGIAVLIIVLSVMNGFREHIESTMLGNQSHLTINLHDRLQANQIISKIINLGSNISEINPVLSEQAILKIGPNIIPVNITTNIDTDAESISNLQEVQNITDQKKSKNSKANIKTIVSKTQALNNKIKISSALAMNYGLSKNDKVILAAPILKNSVLGPQPRFKQFVISGFIDFDQSQKSLTISTKELSEIKDNNKTKSDTASDISTDNTTVSTTKPVIYNSAYNKSDLLMDYYTLLKFFDYPENYITGLELNSTEPLKVAQTKKLILDANILPEDSTVTTWQESNASLFQAIKLERISIIILLLVIITVACFNILSGLYIQVSEKRKDIAILRTLGITRNQISSIFIVQGLFIAILGGMFGVVLGCLITEYLDSMMFWLQKFNLISYNNSFFYAIATNAIDIKINFNEVAQVFGMSLVLCFIASIIPALKSSKIILLEALRDE